METSSAPAAPPAEPRPSFILRHQFLIYRLFSLSGLIPVGAYMVVHLATNASIINGPMTFQEQVDRIHSLGAVLPLVEWVFIFLPIMFHAFVGWLIISGAMPNTNSYPYASNIRYTLQRATGIIAFFFILFHVAQLHSVLGAPFEEMGGAAFDAEHAASSAAMALQPTWIKVVYAVGMLACVYHLSNGLWTQGITWGIWTSAAAQQRASWISVVVGLLLAVIGLSALFGMWTVDVDKAIKVEDAMNAQQAEILKLQEEPAVQSEAAAETTPN